jgi:hypothetical protein
MKIEVSIGEIVDKLSILQIKTEFIKDEEKLKNVKTEYDYLLSIVENDLKISTESPEYLELWYPLTKNFGKLRMILETKKELKNLMKILLNWLGRYITQMMFALK